MENNKYINELISQINQQIVKNCLYDEIIKEHKTRWEMYKHSYEASIEREHKYVEICDKWKKECEGRDKIISEYADLLDAAHKREYYYHGEMTGYYRKILNIYKLSFLDRLKFLFDPFYITDKLLNKVINKNDDKQENETED